MKLSRCTYLALALAACVAAALLAKTERRRQPEAPAPAAVPATGKLGESELLFRVKEAKDTIEKIASNNLDEPLAEAGGRAVATLEGAFDAKYDSYKDIDMTRAGIETFMNRV